MDVDSNRKNRNYTSCNLGLLPDFELPLEEEFDYIWEIPSYNALKSEKKVFSPNFQVCGESWRILMFPLGNGSESLSLYLDFGEVEQRKESNWFRCVQFAIRIFNSSDPSVESIRDASHRFTLSESDWGFTHFIRLNQLITPLPGKSKPILENDTFKIELLMRVYKDPVGTLWHNFNNWDSKKETGLVGIANQGATCYMNSLLQSLYFTKEFTRAVFEIPTEKDIPTKSVALALQRVFYGLMTEDQPVDTRELTKSFGWDAVDSFMQHDIQEFNRVLQDNLETKMKGTKAEGSIEKLFVGKMKSYIKCVNVQFESSREETYYDIQLNVKGKKNLEESFKDYISVEMLDGENKYMAEGHGLQDAKKGVVFTKFPPVLQLQLKRFEYDFMKDAMVKINDRYEFPEEIVLNSYLDTIPQVEQKYILHGILVHAGDVQGGHYVAFLKPKRNGKWFKFDDDRVTPVSDKEVFEENFGGDYVPPPSHLLPLSVLTGQQNQTPVKAPKIQKRLSSAYMLVYFREADMDHVLSEVTMNDVPGHVISCLKEEKIERERLLREQAERHLFLNIRVFQGTDAQHHQGFDLFDSQAGLMLKIKKQEKWLTFKQDISKQLNVDANRIRMWIFTRRQNHTTRPETYLHDREDATVEMVLSALMKLNAREIWIYLEVSSQMIGNSYFPEDNQDGIVLFIKYFDIKRNRLEYLGTLYVNKSMRGSDLVPMLLEKANIESNEKTNIKIYEEIRPGMVEALKLKNTLNQNELITGDILCFQLDNEVTAPEYYDYLDNLIQIPFSPRIQSDNNGKANLQFYEMFSKKDTYDQLAAKVGARLNTDPSMLRFFVNPTGGDVPKQLIKRVENQSLAEVLTSNYYNTHTIAPYFWYEVSDISFAELETKKLVKVTWLDDHFHESKTIDLLPKKTDTVKELLELIMTKLPAGSPKIKLLEVQGWRQLRVMEPTDLVMRMDYSYYAEEDKPQILKENEKVIHVFHFSKDPIRSHSMPFFFTISLPTTVKELRQSIQTRLGVNEREFTKIKLATVNSNNKFAFLENETDVIKEWDNNNSLGLEHVDKNAKTGKFGVERAIKIHN
jgi:ubiquitin carboxyl-terminal hydrolase 7